MLIIILLFAQQALSQELTCGPYITGQITLIGCRTTLVDGGIKGVRDAQACSCLCGLYSLLSTENSCKGFVYSYGDSSDKPRCYLRSSYELGKGNSGTVVGRPCLEACQFRPTDKRSQQEDYSQRPQTDKKETPLDVYEIATYDSQNIDNSYEQDGYQAYQSPDQVDQAYQSPDQAPNQVYQAPPGSDHDHNLMDITDHYHASGSDHEEDHRYEMLASTMKLSDGGEGSSEDYGESSVPEDYGTADLNTYSPYFESPTDSPYSSEYGANGQGGQEGQEGQGGQGGQGGPRYDQDGYTESFDSVDRENEELNVYAAGSSESYKNLDEEYSTVQKPRFL